jgi:hypothetical protein
MQACGAFPAILLSAVLPMHVAAQEAAIPPEYQGFWGFATGQCTAKDWRKVDTVHRISSDKTDWWEASCDVKDVARAADEKRVLKVQLSCSGEGEEWTSRELWRLVDIDRGRYLIAAIPERSLIQIYRRCE